MYPFIHIFGKTIGTYGICMVLGVLLAGYLSIRKGKKVGIHSEDIIILGATTLGSALICGSLLYIFVTYPISTLIEMIKNGNFDFLSGGIVFYGGLIGGLLGALLGSRIAKRPISDLIPVVVPFIPLGHAIGRIGCVMAGCCHGMKYDGIFAIYYPNSVLGVSPEQGYFPVQILESLMNLVICGVLLLLGKRLQRKTSVLFLYLSMYAVARFVLEFFRGDEARGIYSGISLSQWISVGLFLFAVVGLLLPKLKSAKRV